MKYLVSISYDGSKLYGFQKLNNHKTVQGELERVLTKLNKTVVNVKGAGRTDRGVHAFDQKAHFELNFDITTDALKLAINSRIDPSIRINSCEVVSDDFHARFDVKSKEYEYIINEGEYDPLFNDYLYNYNHKLDVKKMRKAAKYYIGMHSFEAYTSGEREAYNSIIYNVKIKRKNGLLHITFYGKSFYRYMVRNMVGALMLVGKNKTEPISIKEMLDSKKNLYNYETVPASGLYLKKIKY